MNNKKLWMLAGLVLLVAGCAVTKAALGAAAPLTGENPADTVGNALGIADILLSNPLAAILVALAPGGTLALVAVRAAVQAVRRERVYVESIEEVGSQKLKAKVTANAEDAGVTKSLTKKVEKLTS